MERPYRDLEIPKLPVGTRVRYDSGKWEACSNSVRFVPDWSTHPWALTRVGTVVPESEYPGHIYPATSPWGIPSFATVVQFDGEVRASWVRTSCLDVIGYAEDVRSGQMEMFPGSA